MLHISNVDGESVHSVQLHPQKPEMGNRVMRRNKVDNVMSVVIGNADSVAVGACRLLCMQ